jgi:hypothetical protein
VEERPLGKLEATLGLSLLAALVVALGWAYVYQLDAPVPATPTDPNWVSAQTIPRNDTAIEQTAYRPEWLSSQDDDRRADVR